MIVYLNDKCRQVYTSLYDCILIYTRNTILVTNYRCLF